MPRMPSGKEITASSFLRRSIAFLRVPTTEPVRTMSSFSQGTVGSQYSPMPRTTRGGSASKKQATTIMAASSAICPAWLLMSRARPRGMRSMPCVSTRNQ